MNFFGDKKKIKLLSSAIILLLANLLFFLTVWMVNKYDKVYLDQFLYQLKTSSAGAHRDLVSSAVVRVGLFGVLLTGVELFLYFVLKGRFSFSTKQFFDRLSKSKLGIFLVSRTLLISVIAIVLSAVLFITQLDVVSYFDTTTTESDFIEKHYVNPLEAKLTYPSTKRNLIYIFLESFENTYSDTIAGGNITQNFMPELTELAKENINFSNNDSIGGALSFTGTTWTAAAMVSQTSGTVVKVPIGANAYGKDVSYMPGVVSLGEVLEKAGYTQKLLVGSNSDFHGRKTYFEQHGDYEILDTVTLKESGRLAEDYDEWWGFEDQKLFEYAKQELTELSKSDKPFNFTMLTADTHFPDGYTCQLCENKYEQQYSNVIACSSKQVYEFISWIKDQPFYNNTTIVISGDHLTMDSKYLAEIDINYVRTIYNCIINSPITPVNEKNREFGTFDMLPTTVAALGIKIEGDRLGVGVNLFSDKKTLTEQYGFETLDKELQKKSEFYNSVFLDMDKKEE